MITVDFVNWSKVHIMFRISLESVKLIVADMNDFLKYVEENFSKLPEDYETIPLAWYLGYYNWRSEKLAAENKISRNITQASKNKSESLSNANDLKAYQDKFAHIDFD